MCCNKFNSNHLIDMDPIEYFKTKPVNYKLSRMLCMIPKNNPTKALLIITNKNNIISSRTLP